MANWTYMPIAYDFGILRSNYGSYNYSMTLQHDITILSFEILDASLLFELNILHYADDGTEQGVDFTVNKDIVRNKQSSIYHSKRRNKEPMLVNGKGKYYIYIQSVTHYEIAVNMTKVDNLLALSQFRALFPFIPQTLTLRTNEARYYQLYIPKNITVAKVKLTGNNGDADLFLFNPIREFGNHGVVD